MRRIAKLQLLGWMIAGVVLLAPAHAQVDVTFMDYARPDLEWYTIETDHFKVHFHYDEETGSGASRTAQVVARIAEDIYAPITALYKHEPATKVDIMLKDYEDYSNGAAYFFDNKIEIWAPSLDSPLRGDHSWLRNVITHEFTHIVQVQLTMKAHRQMPFLYLQYLDYEDARRPDVLYGYPNVIATYPVPVLNNPAWLAEGTAQYQRAGLDYDQWDTHRDMKLRTRVLAGEELSLTDMGGFYSHNSLEREAIYNHGFAFSRYLALTYGEDVLRRLSEALGEWSNWNVERAFKATVGERGEVVYQAWMDELRTQYTERVARINTHAVEGEVIEAEGFANAYPRYSPDGQKLAYITNKGEDFSRTRLLINDLATGEVVAHRIDGLHGREQVGFTCALGHRHTLPRVGGAFAWHPTGESIVFSRIKDTPRGHLVADLYLYDLSSKKAEPLTFGARAHAPAYSPDGAQVAFVTFRDGSANLSVLDVETEVIRSLTAHDDGTQITDPVWHPGGEWIYYARHQRHGRDLWRIRASDGHTEAVLASDADERHPTFDASGRHLYFASDETGIFNLYRTAVGTDPSEHGEAEQLTNVVGGAFMPSLRPDGTLAFARYDWSGYKIARLNQPTPVEPQARALAYAPPSIMGKAVEDTSFDWDTFATYNDTDLASLTPEQFGTMSRRTESLPTNAEGTDEAVAVADTFGTMVPYDLGFTSLSFFPVLRLDQYVERSPDRLAGQLQARTVPETLWRNTKVGVYMSSREVLEGLTLLGGALIGPGSRPAESLGDYIQPTNLLKLERDLFIQLDYSKGFGFLPKRWSPQVSLAMYNIRRNVEQGLRIEEFPCTACFPDTTLADISYSLWQAEASLRSKVNRATVLELGYRASPYSVVTERFFSKENDQFIPASSSRYFEGAAVHLAAYFELQAPNVHSNVVPDGLDGSLRLERERGRLLSEFEINDGILTPVYEENINYRITLDARWSKRLGRWANGGDHGVGVRFRASSLLGQDVDVFYNDFVGGLIGARGYPFYALGGNETGWLQLSYTLPIAPDLRQQAGFLYFDKLYARLYADGAMAYSGDFPGLSEVRKDIGAELRLGLGSFYLLPTAVFVSATYGLDAFNFQLDDGFLTDDGSNFVRYGKELQWHFGILFGFDL
ncbi:MAG: LpqB family beta-propeller domain-containing protein [Bacteroidota bacterium]